MNEEKDKFEIREPEDQDKMYDKMHETFLKEAERLGCGIFREPKPKYWTISAAIRNLLSLGVIYMVFRETGGWTAFVCFLLMAHTEAQLFSNQMNRYRWNRLLRLEINEKKESIAKLLTEDR